ncbi:hypothetical protein PTKIN_Ptkin08bG0182100 [Pterospermum kingtungense]
MGKGFKLKISKVFPSFQSCCSKIHSNLPSNHDPSFFRLSSVNPNPITLHSPPSSKPTSKLPHYSSIKRHVSSAFSSIGCGLGSRSSPRYYSEADCSESPPPPTPEFHWEEEDSLHVIAKAYDDYETPRRKIYKNEDDVVVPSPPPPPPNTERKKRRYRKKKTTPKNRISTSSTADSGLFSSESLDDDDINEEETEALVSSSRSFYTDSSSEFNASLETIRETVPMRHHKKKRNNNKRVKKAKRCVVKERSTAMMRLSSASESESPTRLSSFLRGMMPCTVDGKVRESFAVVKKSEDPYEDFKRSMMEMILQKQMFEDKDLEQLLHCFLSLNSRDQHGVIVQAFVEIWEALFSPKSTGFPVTSALKTDKQ